MPFRVYADFDCSKTHVDDQKNALFKRRPIEVGYYSAAPLENTSNSNFGGACVNWFVNQMLELHYTANEYFKRNITLNLSPEEEEQFQLAEACWLCGKPFSVSKSNVSFKSCEEPFSFSIDSSKFCEEPVIDHENMSKGFLKEYLGVYLFFKGKNSIH